MLFVVFCACTLIMSHELRGMDPFADNYSRFNIIQLMILRPAAIFFASAFIGGLFLKMVHSSISEKTRQISLIVMIVLLIACIPVPALLISGGTFEGLIVKFFYAYFNIAKSGIPYIVMGVLLAVSEANRLQ